MKPTATIRLLTDSKNEKGDFFTSLIEDLFHAQGYDKVYRDLAQPGREIDIQSEHRHESKSVAIECKAHQDKIGGDDINKFRGAIDGEREQLAQQNLDKEIVTYFVSLGGFTTAAIAQENKRRKHTRVILWDSPTVIKELEKCHMLPTDTEVAARAGQCVQYAGLSDVVIDEIELLAHPDLSYVKLIIYSRNGERTHFALIHSSGIALADGPAQTIIAADKKNKGTLHKLKYLPPAPPTPDRQAVEQQAKDCYRDWINAECGYIHLDGLPAEADYSTKSLKLERLFVPLRAIIDKENPRAEDKKFTSSKHETYNNEPITYPISELLKAGSRLALLAAPGGGKSTLLKRLATAYTSDERRLQIEDGLISHNWLPLFVRCRELRAKVTDPIKSILEEIPAQTSMQPEEADAFRTMMREALRAGKVLLLIDGLDEIPEEADRKIFAKNLRTFLSLNPQITAVVTSREAGFRAVAGVIADACQHARLASLNPEDIENLCTQWHIEVANLDSLKVREQAHKLTRDIFANRSIYALARNPLLLTTLLVVKRSIGELPRNRAGLYEEAVRLLVKTWNVEGYGYNLASLSERQALAQLSYVACTMLEEGIKQIEQGYLYSLLHKAKEVLAAELHYVTVSPEDFIEQVERRSSLLISVGKSARTLEPLYEFRHLTFQEYLAARGYVKEQHARRPEDLKLVDVLSDHFTDENWAEVIPLASALAEHKANSIIRELINSCDKWDNCSAEESAELSNPYFVLAQCIIDEVAILPATMTLALEKLALCCDELGERDLLKPLLRGKAGCEFKEIIEKKFFDTSTDSWLGLVEGMRGIAHVDLTKKEEDFKFFLKDADEVEYMISELHCSDVERKIKAATNMGILGYELFSADDALNKGTKSYLTSSQAKSIRSGLNSLLSSSKAAVYTAAWTLAWCGENRLVLGTTHPLPEEILSLFDKWVLNYATPHVIAWAITEQPLMQRDAILNIGFNPLPYKDALLQAYSNNDGKRGNATAQLPALMGWYFRMPWNDEQLVDVIDRSYPLNENTRYYGLGEEERFQRAKAMLNELGEAGKAKQKERVKAKKRILDRLSKKRYSDDDLPF